jgi:hypothetical protein
VLDAGGDVPNGLLPVDARNPTIILADYQRDNWLGEYAVLFANAAPLGAARLWQMLLDPKTYAN